MAEETFRLWLDAGGRRLLVGAGNAPIYAKRELLQECCCEGEEPGCPADCTECPYTVLVTVSQVLGDHCSLFNKAWTLSYSMGCLWIGGGMSGDERILLHLFCQYSKWTIYIVNDTYPEHSTTFQVAAVGCFPRSGWLRTSGTCTGGKVSVAW